MSIPPIPAGRLVELLVARSSQTLAEYGITEEPDQFTDRLVDLMHSLYPAFSLDDILVRPREAIRLCDAARQQSGNYDLPDDLVLRLLLNRRKNG